MKRSLAFRDFFVIFVAIFLFLAIQSYFSMLVANSERVSINLELGSIERMFKAQQYLGGPSDLDPASWQKKRYSLLIQDVMHASSLLYIDNIYQIKKGSWGYSKKKKALIYRIKEPKYFKSKSGLPFIYLSTIESNHKVKINISSFKWCKRLAWWGCRVWY